MLTLRNAFILDQRCQAYKMQDGRKVMIFYKSKKHSEFAPLNMKFECLHIACMFSYTVNVPMHCT